MARGIRIAVLLFVLATVAQTAWLTRARVAEWRHPLLATIYPIVGDGSALSHRHVAELRAAQFEPIERWFAEQARAHGLALAQPLEVRLGPPVTALPPAPAGRDPASAILWSLQMRFWAWRHTPAGGRKPDVRVFVLYHDGASSPRLPHSAGLQKGMLGVVHAFANAEMATRNDIVIAHELLHTLGATDKYDPQTNRPVHPDGYAEPSLKPLHPQRRAEIMAGRIARSAESFEMAEGLAQTVIGMRTATEIHWRK